MCITLELILCQGNFNLGDFHVGMGWGMAGFNKTQGLFPPSQFQSNPGCRWLLIWVPTTAMWLWESELGAGTHSELFWSNILYRAPQKDFMTITAISWGPYLAQSSWSLLNSSLQLSPHPLQLIRLLDKPGCFWTSTRWGERSIPSSSHSLCWTLLQGRLFEANQLFTGLVQCCQCSPVIVDRLCILDIHCATYINCVLVRGVDTHTF